MTLEYVHLDNLLVSSFYSLTRVQYLSRYCPFVTSKLSMSLIVAKFWNITGVNVSIKLALPNSTLRTGMDLSSFLCNFSSLRVLPSIIWLEVMHFRKLKLVVYTMAQKLNRKKRPIIPLSMDTALNAVISTPCPPFKRK